MFRRRRGKLCTGVLQLPLDCMLRGLQQTRGRDPDGGGDALPGGPSGPLRVAISPAIAAQCAYGPVPARPRLAHVAPRPPAGRAVAVRYRTRPAARRRLPAHAVAPTTPAGRVINTPHADLGQPPPRHALSWPYLAAGVLKEQVVLLRLGDAQTLWTRWDHKRRPVSPTSETGEPMHFPRRLHGPPPAAPRARTREGLQTPAQFLPLTGDVANFLAHLDGVFVRHGRREQSLLRSSSASAAPLVDRDPSSQRRHCRCTMTAPERRPYRDRQSLHQRTPTAFQRTQTWARGCRVLARDLGVYVRADQRRAAAVAVSCWFTSRARGDDKLERHATDAQQP